ncbi:MAG TPA: hypothetical protein VFO65_04415 [Acidimicrobiales bacterium]|nr:hypothetical protein [Acidimicrobiales bacterium]
MSVRTVGRVAVAVAVATLLGALPGCSLERSGYQFLRNPDTGTYFKLPIDWTVHGVADHNEGIEKAGMSVEEARARVPFITTFFATPAEAGALGLDIERDTPAGLVSVKYLTLAERDALDFANLREQLLPYSTWVESGVAKQQKREDLEQEGGFRGQRTVFTLTDDKGVYMVDQTAFVDRSTTRVYLLIIGCKAECYQAHESEITEVARSLTLKET